ncbi:MAG TPA: VWA domain-containing protein [Actinocatenispora sp.]
MAHTRVFVAAIAAGLVVASLTGTPASADDTPEYAPTMLVLDASGSMQQAVSGGGTRMDAARKAAHTFIDAAPSEAKVGLTVYGTGTGSSDAEKSAGCKDVKVLHAPDSIDKRGMNAAVDTIKARGYTPIGASLSTAAAALPKSGPRSIVLVSDGEDTCTPPDPCKVAQELHRQGVDLVVNTVGFGVDDKSRQQLTCIAQATGGTYSDAPDSAALQRVLPRVSASALRNYRPAGSPITGTAQYRTAPVATPGQYLDTIGHKETRYYAVDVPTGATAYFSGTLSFPHRNGIDETEDINTMSVRVYGRDGADCTAFESAEATNSSDGESLTISKTWTGATEDPRQYDKDSDSYRCRGGGRYWFAVQWETVSAGVPARLPIELLVGIEPKATDPGAAPATSPVRFTTPGGTPKAVTGGGSYNVAATLDGSGSYTDTLQRGEYVYYRVKLRWGQGLAYRVRFGPSGTDRVEDLSTDATTLSSPLRKDIAGDHNSYNGRPDTLAGSVDDLATLPVRYRNRESHEPADHDQSVPGWYYIAVKFSAARENPSAPPVNVTIDLTVAGTPESGPTYASAVDGGIFGENATPPTPHAGASRSGAALATASDESGLPSLAVAGIVAALVLVGGGAGTALLVRRRRRTGDSPAPNPGS